MNVFRLRSFAALVSVALTAPAAHAIGIDWVTVGDPGNAADTNGLGAVTEAFQMMKFEWTNSQYAHFLNAVDPNGTNPRALFNGQMQGQVRGGIMYTSTNALGNKYQARPNMGDKPVNWVSWWDAARAANWLHNGQGSGDTETGAYTISGGQTSGIVPPRNPGAKYWVPTDHQWYKAAYYKGGSTSAGYWTYAIQNNAIPGAVSAGVTGIGSAGGLGNFANYNSGAAWDGVNGNVTTVGTNGGASAYGTFDQSGNVAEWTDSDGVTPSDFRGERGGSWENSAGFASSAGFTNFANAEDNWAGFRLASLASAPVPEIDPAGMGSVLALVTGALGLLERRRPKAT